jgi:hypothetical protein
MGRFLRNGPQLWAGLAFMLAFGLAGVTRADGLPVPGVQNDVSWLGFIVALLWFMTSLVNGLRGSRERGGAPPRVPELTDLKGSIADLRNAHMLSDDLNKARFDKHERRLDRVEAHLEKQDSTLVDLAKNQHETAAGVQELLRLSRPARG